MKCNLRVFISDFASVRYDGVDWVWRKGPARKKGEARIKTTNPESAMLLRSAQAFKVDVDGRETYGGRIESVNTQNGRVKLVCQLEESVFTKEE